MQTFPSMYKGMANCFLQTLKADGIMRGLYAGTIPALVANVAENSVLFAAYGGCQKVISNVLGNIIFLRCTAVKRTNVFNLKEILFI